MPQRFLLTVLQGLNVGGGGGSTSEIRLRLRRASREADLMPFESVLGTMLHELTHNHVGCVGEREGWGKARGGLLLTCMPSQPHTYPH